MSDRHIGEERSMVEDASANPLTSACRRTNTFTYCFAVLAVLITPFDLFIAFPADWAAHRGDTGVPRSPGSTDNLVACLILALIAVVLGFGTILTAPWLPVSVAGLRARRVIRGVAAGAIALAVIGLLCLM